jgi:hypothetical protein
MWEWLLGLRWKPSGRLRSDGVAARTGGFGKLFVLRRDLIAGQLPGLGFKLADEGECAFGVPV